MNNPYLQLSTRNLFLHKNGLIQTINDKKLFHYTKSEYYKNLDQINEVINSRKLSELCSKCNCDTLYLEINNLNEYPLDIKEFYCIICGPIRIDPIC